MHPILNEVVAKGYVHLSGVATDTLTYAETLGEVFRAVKDEDPIVTMKIEGDDPMRTPYASCRTPALSLHTDYATFVEPPRFTVTHCIEPDPDFPLKGVSIVLLLRPAIDHLKVKEPALLELLRREAFPFRRNAEHNHYHKEVATYAILDGKDRVRFDRTLIVPYLERSEYADRAMLMDAVLRFEEVCSEHAERVEVALDRREVLIVDNRRVLHSRSECTARQGDGQLLSREVNLAFLM
jgi:hypothetical protein